MNIFSCPVCRATLFKKEKSFVCKNKHNFDISKSGYVSLLLPNQKNAKDPGDNKLMVNARRDFLNKDFYKPLSNLLSTTVFDCVNKNPEPVIFDVGCGEGYYTSSVYKLLKRKKIAPRMAGFDISKFALDVAAKRENHIDWAVSSLFHLPCEDNKADILLNLFAPFCLEEFTRVLKPNGILIIVVPGQKHLWQLKKAIYDNPYEKEKHDTIIEGFTLIGQKHLSKTISLTNNEDINNLFTMTPYYYKTSVDDTKKLKELNNIDIEIEFEILIYRVGKLNK